MPRITWRRAGLPVLVAAVSAVPFLPTLFAGFLADDWFFVAAYRGAQVPFGRFVWRALVSLEGIPTSFYRPLSFISLAAQVRAMGADPVALHAASLLLHGVAAALAFVLARRLLGGAEWPALLGTLLVAWSPRRTEAVAWISCRPDLVGAVCALASLLFFDTGFRRARRWPWHAAALAAWWLALLGKESALLVPLAHAALAWHAADPAASRGERRSRTLRACAPYLLSIPVFVVLRRIAIGAWIGGYGAGALAVGPATLVSAAKHVAFQLLPPIEPGGLPVHLAFPRAFVGALVLLLIAVLARPLWAARGDLALRVGAAWLVAGILPVITLPVSPWTSLNDRLLYLPGFGVALLAAAMIGRVTPRVAFLAGLLALGVLGTWSSTLSMRWERAGALSGRLLASLAEKVRGTAAPRIYLASVPDSLGGAYMLRNGVNEALSTMGVGGPPRVVSLSFYFVAPGAEASRPVRAVAEGPGALLLESEGTEPQLVLPMGDRSRLAARYEVDGIPDRFGRYRSLRVALPEAGDFFLLSPDRVDPVPLR